MAETRQNLDAYNTSTRQFPIHLHIITSSMYMTMGPGARGQLLTRLVIWRFCSSNDLIFKMVIIGAPGSSVSWASNSWFWLRWWSHSLWTQAPHWALCCQCGACLGFSPPHPRPSSALSLSLSLKDKWINLKFFNEISKMVTIVEPTLLY